MDRRHWLHANVCARVCLTTRPPAFLSSFPTSVRTRLPAILNYRRSGVAQPGRWFPEALRERAMPELLVTADVRCHTEKKKNDSGIWYGPVHDALINSQQSAPHVPGNYPWHPSGENKPFKVCLRTISVPNWICRGWWMGWTDGEETQGEKPETMSRSPEPSWATRQCQCSCRVNTSNRVFYCTQRLFTYQQLLCCTKQVSLHYSQRC